MIDLLISTTITRLYNLTTYSFFLEVIHIFFFFCFRYARRFISTSVIRRYSRVHVWKPVTVKEFLGFIAVVLNMGLIRKPTIAEYWNKSQKSQQTQWFRNMFSRNRFQLILKFLHVVDNRRVADRNSQAYR